MNIIPGEISKEALLSADHSIQKKFAHLVAVAKKMRFSNKDEDAIYSIVKNRKGELFSTSMNIDGLPDSADGNGSYCIGLRLEYDLFHKSDYDTFAEFLKFNASRLMM